MKTELGWWSAYQITSCTDEPCRVIESNRLCPKTRIAPLIRIRLFGRNTSADPAREQEPGRLSGIAFPHPIKKHRGASQKNEHWRAEMRDPAREEEQGSCGRQVGRFC